MVLQIPDAVDTVLCAPDVGWKYHPKHVEEFRDINKLCNVASCWIYIGILLGAHYILHVSRIRVKVQMNIGPFSLHLYLQISLILLAIFFNIPYLHDIIMN
jgi:hypothetical protein